MLADVIHSGGGWAGGVYSAGDGPVGGEPLAYFYMNTHTEFPSNAEVPLAVVRQALHDFPSTGGERPAGIAWQPEA